MKFSFRGSMIKRYEGKADGVLRGYDMKSAGSRIATVIIFLICVAMIAFMLMPVIWVFLAGFKDIKEMTLSQKILPKTFSLANYKVTWDQLKFVRYYVNSGLIVAGGVVCAVVFNGLMAYALAILRPRGHKVVFWLVMWSLLIPPTTGIVAQVVNIHHVMDFIARVFQIAKPQDTLLAVTPLWLIWGANAFWLVLFKEFFEELPKDYMEAARIDGCSSLGIFTRIIMPLSKPIVIVIAIFATTAVWSDFLLPNLLLSNSHWETVMVRLFEFRTAIKVTDVDKLRAVVFSIIPPIILFAAFQKQITKGVTAGGIKG
jgi:multiple sugar transport system permease protein